MFVNNFPTSFGRVHVTHNRRGKRWRYTFHFQDGTVFHSNKRWYRIAELKKIYLREVPLNPQHNESRSK